MTSGHDPRIGSELGPYRIDSVIGRGGMGVVYLATHTGLERRVALKLLAPDYAEDEAFRARFLRESRLAAAIDHPNIIPIYEAGEVDGTYFLAMRYVEGTDLQARFGAGSLAPREAVALLGQVASALDAAHGAGLVHRDVKPANILLAPGQGADRADHAYLTDFGLTKQRGADSDLTRAGSFLGTVDYVAPEQIEGKPLDGRADQYSLAAIAVAALTGEVPFPRDSDVAVINAHLRDEPPSVHGRRQELPPAADTVVARALAKRPADRYPDCRAFVEDLRAALDVSGTDLRRGPSAPGPRRAVRVGVGLGAVLLVAVAVLALGIGGLGRGAGTSPSAGPASPGSSAAAAASTGPSASASETVGDAFPNAAEQRLAASLPEVLRPTCRRGPYNVVDGNSGASTPTASLLCSPDVSTGAGEVVIRQFRPETVKEGIVTGMISRLAGGGPVPPGDCATSPRANGRWTVAGRDRGAIICFVDQATGDALLYWGYDAEAILVRARNPKGDSRVLYSFFEKYARFFSP